MKPLLMTSGGIFGAILGFGAVSTIVLHISMASRSLTNLETALFNILQFVFSVAFAWVLSRSSSRREFTESQKRFAVAAYRRICEIDAATNRLVARIYSRFPKASLELSTELRILLASALGIQQTVKSSIADWADIIEEEMVAMDQIAELEDEKQDALLESRQGKGSSDSIGHLEEMKTRLALRERELETLKRKLPPPLRVLSKSRDEPIEDLFKAMDAVEAKFGEKDWIQLSGFWAPEAGFDRSIRELSPGSQMIVSSGDVGESLLLVKDMLGRSVGVLTNPVRVSYSLFSRALTSVLVGDPFPVSLVKVQDPEEGSMRVDFEVRADRRTCDIF